MNRPRFKNKLNIDCIVRNVQKPALGFINTLGDSFNVFQYQGFCQQNKIVHMCTVYMYIYV